MIEFIKGAQRIQVLGSSGAGKSTIARRLGKALNLNVVHLDSYFWQPGWTETPQDEWFKVVERLQKEQRWVIDGNYTASLPGRLGRADRVVFLQLGRLKCILRVIKRRIRYRGVSRPELGPGCYEKIDLEFLTWIWNYPRDVKPRIMALLKEFPGEKVLVLNGAREINRFLRELDQCRL